MIQYIKGYIRIRISGNKVEHFLNMCSSHKIHLWNVSYENHSYESNISIKDFKKVKPFVRKTKIKLVIVERYGFPFFINSFRKRKLFIYGFFLCILLLHLLTGFIWNIQFKGNLSYTNETLLKQLNSIEVEKGMKISDVNCARIVNYLRKNFEDIIWASASIEGSKLIIHVKENEASDLSLSSIQNNSKSAYDIVADGEYIISDIIIRKGISQIDEGDRVNKGTILVSGHVPIYNDAKEIVGYQSCTSDADIIGKQNIFYENTVSTSYEKKEYNSISKKEYYLVFGKYRFVFGSCNHNYEQFVQNTKQYTNLPFGLGVRTLCQYNTKKISYRKDEIQEILSSEFQYFCNNLKKKGVAILENDVKIYTWSDKASARGSLTIEKEVGQLKISKQPETGDTINGNDGNNN